MHSDSARTPWLTLVAVAGGLFLAVMSTTVISVALPTIGTDLGAGPTGLQWIVDAYVLVYASLLVPGGTLGDRYGRKGLFITGVLIFGAGALISGLAPDLPVLLAGRVVQGLGPALLVPGSLTIIRASFPDERSRAAAIGIWSTGSGLALAVGPLVGGSIVDAFGWRWVQLLNVPLAALLALLSARVIPRLPRTPAEHSLDWPGALLSVAGAAALCVALIEGQRWGWLSVATLGCGATGLALLAAFGIWEYHRPAPLIDVRLFARPAFAAANIAGLMVFFAFIGLIVYLSAFFQKVQGDSPIQAGLHICPIGVAFAVAAPISGRLTGRLGPLPPMIVGLLGGGGAILGLLVQISWWNLALGGFGIGLCLTPMTATAVGAVGSDRAGMASAVHNALRQFGQVLGVAVLGALVYARPGDLVTGLHHALRVAGLALLVTGALIAVLLVRPIEHRA